jgi:hypothetical protein
MEYENSPQYTTNASRFGGECVKKYKYRNTIKPEECYRLATKNS